jgi:hypothetical protein
MAYGQQYAVNQWLAAQVCAGEERRGVQGGGGGVQGGGECKGVQGGGGEGVMEKSG